MKLRLDTLAAAFVAAVVVLTALHPGGFGVPITLAAGDCTVQDMTFDDQERAFAVLINDYRASIGVPPLTVSENLNRSASWLAKDMADKRYFSHEDSLGRHSEERGADCGTTTKIGENIAAGPTRDTAQEAFDAWKASEGHDKNMRRADYLQIGIARYYRADSEWGWYWVTDFSLNTDNTNLLDIEISLPVVGDIGIGIPNPLSTQAPTSTPTRTPTSTPTRTPTATPTRTATAQPSTAQLTSPQPGSTLSGTTATFSWTAPTGASGYQLYVGTTAGGYDIRNVRTTSTSTTVSNLPRGSRTIYVRLWTQTGSTWRYNDYTLTSAPDVASTPTSTATATRTPTATSTRTAAATATRTATATATPASSSARVTSPPPGSTFSGTSATFSWTAVSGATGYQLYVGTTAGGYDIRNVRTTSTSTAVTNLPRGSRTVYVRLWTQVGSTWSFNDYTYTSAP